MYMQSIGSKPSGWLLLLVCLFLSWQANGQGQPGFENRIVIHVDDPSVQATVDNPNPENGSKVTLTLTGLTSGKTAGVTAGTSPNAEDVHVTPSTDNTYTMTMPDGPLYIYVKVENSGQLIRVQTPGVGALSAKVELSYGDKQNIKAGKTLVPKGELVTATLTLTPHEGQPLTLQRITGRSTDGTWVMMPVEVSDKETADTEKTITFTMPASEVILTYTIKSSMNVTETPTEDGDDKDPVEVPEIAWPDADLETPVLVISEEIEEDKLAELNEELLQLPEMTEEDEVFVELVDISLQLSDGERVQPDSPVTVTYPYPQGTDENWNFCILHQISDGGEATRYETIYPESLHIGLRFQVSSFSPFAIIYTPPFVPEGSEEGDAFEPIRVKGISLSQSALTLRPNGSRELTVTFNPADATDKRIVWTSDNESVVTVSEDGTVTAKGTGKAVVTARSKNGGFLATCQVTVRSNNPGPGPDPDPDPTPKPDPDPEPPVANEVITGDAPVLRVSAGCLQVDAARAVAVQVFGVSGQMQAVSGSAVSHRIALPAGLWLVSIDGAKAIKILIP